MKSNANDFIEKSKKIHNYKYDYSLVDYKNNKSKVNIICPVHGIFSQFPNHHIKGHGCNKCGYISSKSKNKFSFEDFLLRARDKHKYKFKYNSQEFNGMNNKISIICSEHGEFKQKPVDHLRTHGCPKCGYLEMIKKSSERVYSNSDFIKIANKIHNKKYIYDKLNYNRSFEKVEIICPKHGLFTQIARDHLVGHGCLKCNRSLGEERISTFLKENDILFETQKCFKLCFNKRSLRFDFFLKDKNLCIEYDGQQHFFGWGNSKSSLKYIKKLDNIKNIFCKQNNIKLLRIPYYQFDNIEKILIKKIGEIT